MNNNTSTKAMVESGLMTALMVVLMLAIMYIPLLGYVTIFIWPLPIAALYVRHGKKYSIMSLIAAGLVMTIVSGDIVSALYMILGFGMASIMLGYCAEKKKPAHITIALMAVAMFIGVLVMLKALQVFTGEDLIAVLTEVLNSSIEAVKQAVNANQLLGVSQEATSQLFEVFTAKYIISLMPSFLATSSACFAFISYAIARKLFKRLGYELEPIKPFSSWYIPTPMVAVVVGSIIVIYIAHYLGWQNSGDYFNNAYLIFSYMFIINGLCAVDYFLKAKGLPRAVRVLICIIIAFSGLATILIIIGLLDNSLNLRKLDKSRIRRV